MRVCLWSILSHLLYCSLVVMDTTLKVNPSMYPIVFTIFLFEFPVLRAKSPADLILWMGWARLPSPSTHHKPLLCFKARPYCPASIPSCHKQEEVLKLEHLQGRITTTKKTIKTTITGLPPLTSPVSV